VLGSQLYNKLTSMPDFKPKPGSFLPFLEYEQRNKQSPQTTAVSPLTLLEILARQAQLTLPLGDLQTLSGMDPARYRDALKSLRDAGYVVVEGEALDAVVRLTDKGKEVTRLAQPARSR
jgi:DNA-binding MarR family transcriptional regulator